MRSNRAFWKNPFIVILATAILYLASQVMGAVLVLPFVNFIPNKNIQYATILFATFIAFCGFVSIAINTLGFKWKDIGVSGTKFKNFLLVIPVFFVYGIISTVLTQLASRYPGFDINQAQELGLNTAGLESVVPAFIMLVIITPLFEEFLFRGVLFHGLRKRLPLLVSAFITSIVFAAAHGQANVALDTFALSMFLCLLVERTRSIWPSVVLHAVKNFLAFGALFLGWFS